MNDRFKTLYGAVDGSAAAFADNTALYYMGVRISYAELKKDIDACAGWFSTRGIKAGDAVTLCMPNIPQCVVLFYALSKIGAIAHMVHPLAPEAQLKSYMRSVGSKMLAIPDIMTDKYPSLVGGDAEVLLCSPAYYLGFIRRMLFGIKTMPALSGIKRNKNVYSYADAVKCAPPSDPDFSDPDAAAVYLHSGGTGGQPKTIVLSSGAINALTDNSLEILGIKRFTGGSMLAVLPMFHGFGLAMGVHAMLCYGGCNTLMPKFHTADTIKLIEQNKINYLIGVPVLYEALLKKPDFSGDKLKNLRQAFVGGDYVPKRLLSDFNARMEENGSEARLYEGYGLTETVTVCAVNTTYASRAGSVGRPVGGVSIAAFDAASNPLPAGETGELCISGDELMNGYLHDEADEKRVFFTFGGKKWVRSGDVGSVDSDGFVFFKSRIKRIAKVNGVTVFPSEIERLCMDEIAGIKEACAAAVSDERTGDSVTLFVTLRAGAVSGEELSGEIKELVKNRLSVYAVPKRVIYVDEFPKTLVGKVDVNALKEKYCK